MLETSINSGSVSEEWWWRSLIMIKHTVIPSERVKTRCCLLFNGSESATWLTLLGEAYFIKAK
jgi:hypothetical protein